MAELLKQALVLTGWGMGMTFLALGALVLGMYLMAALAKDKNEMHTDIDTEVISRQGEDQDQDYLDPISNEAKWITNNNNDQDVVAAACVAVALALTQESEENKNITPASITGPVAWDHYVRGRHLSQRTRYEQLKHRR